MVLSQIKLAKLTVKSKPNLRQSISNPRKNKCKITYQNHSQSQDQSQKIETGIDFNLKFKFDPSQVKVRTA